MSVLHDVEVGKDSYDPPDWEWHCWTCGRRRAAFLTHALADQDAMKHQAENADEEDVA